MSGLPTLLQYHGTDFMTGAEGQFQYQCNSSILINPNPLEDQDKFVNLPTLMYLVACR